MKQDLTSGNVSQKLMAFAAPLIIGNILQQIYSITDTLIVGKWLGSEALAAVGSTYTLTTFLYSIVIGMCMGSGGLISYYHGVRDREKTSQVVTGAFVIIAVVAMGLELLTLWKVKGILHLLQTPGEVFAMARAYTNIILAGMFFVFLYNFYAYVLRAFGNSVIPMYALGVSTLLNVGLDILFVVGLHKGVEGAAIATVIAQICAGIGLLLYCRWKEPASKLRFSRKLLNRNLYKEILHMALGASIQQSVMNFGILMIQGLVNSFGAATMAAFTVAVKIDTLAYMPAQEFANAFSLFISKNNGARKQERIREGIRDAFIMVTVFCLGISILVFLLARPLMGVFLQKNAAEILRIGIRYLRIEGVFYVGIGWLFLFYGYFRGMNRPGISVVLTIISLGTRVILAYTFAPVPQLGVLAIWIAIPVGWLLADLAGWGLMHKLKLDKDME